MNKQVILTGLRANNDLHLGNYLGALLPIIDLAKQRAGEYQVNLFVPDLHSFTTPVNHGALHEQIMRNLQLYVAAGLPIDHDGVFLYRQSYIPAHSELTWILDCFTGMGEMARMTQYKDKSARMQEDRISVGLFNYPILMAADMLLYNASYVPVGDDQTQHLEFTRDIAARMNNQFGELFTVPKPVSEQHTFFGNDQGLRIRDLIDPTKKMSKSDETGRGVLFLSDSPEVARKKIMSATTDSFGRIAFDVKERPGISNLLQMLALLTGQEQATVIATWEGRQSYGELKGAVADATEAFLKDFQKRLVEVDQTALLANLTRSEVAMNEVANKTLLRVQRAVGLRPKRTKFEPQRAGNFIKPSIISFEDFKKIDMRIATVQAASVIEGSDKLIRLEIQIGNETRTIVTGMREYYSPEYFPGKQIVILVNLKPQKFKGIMSQGMLLAAEGQAGPILLVPEQSAPSGSPVE